MGKNLDLADLKDRLCRKAVLSHKVELRLLSLFHEGKLFGTVHTCLGQEFSGAVISEFVAPGDSVFSNHRCHGHYLSLTADIVGLVAELMGKETGVCGGKGGSQHLYRTGFYSNGIQGGMLPVAAGVALAAKLKGKPQVAISFIGDGTLGEGVLYETLNLASLWHLPLVVVVEDNGIAQTTPTELAISGSVKKRAEAFDIDFYEADTWNWEGLYETSKAAITKSRETRNPSVIHVKTFRLKAHSKGDDTRAKDFVLPYEEKDPVTQLLKQTPEWLPALERDIETAVNKAEASPFASLLTDAPPSKAVIWSRAQLPKKRCIQALNETFQDLIQKNDRVVFLGEDILSPYGGAFKATAELSHLAPERVFTTPISEAAIVGVGTGLALEGFFPLVEIMFGDFLGLAFDQLVNHAAKFREMYHGQVSPHVIVRTPMGGRRGYGPTHSQTLDKHFLGTPGLTVVATNSLIHPNQIYPALIEIQTGPTLVIENKTQYGAWLKHELPEGFSLWHSNDALPCALIRPESRAPYDVTLMGYGGMTDLLVEAAERLFVEEDIVAQVFCPAQIYPFAISAYLPELSRAKHLVIVEEGQGFAGFTSEICAQVLTEAPHLFKSVSRVVPSETIIPASVPLEKQGLPGVDNIVRKCRDLR